MVVFYMIVLEKTRDIGTLRAMGASRSGVAAIFLGYALSIGLIGSLLGLAAAAAIVLNINEIQAFIGSYLGVTIVYLMAGAVGLVLGAVVTWLAARRSERRATWTTLGALAGAVALGLLAFAILQTNAQMAHDLNARYGFTMWRPDIYYFDRIPSQLNPREVAWILASAVVSSILGAVLPAIRAARENPVVSLRYE
jgi:lipoprotein-releasing system permease protein